MQQQTNENAAGSHRGPREQVLAAAAAHREAGLHARAIEALGAWLASQPGDAEALALLAQSLLALRQDAQAQEALLRAMQLAPQHPVVLRTLARLLLRQGKREEALRASEAARALNPADAESSMVLASILGAVGRDADALRLFGEIIAQHPSYGEAYANRAMLLLRQGQADLAIKDAERAAELRPGVASMWATLGNARLKAGDSAGAVGAFRRASEIEPQVVLHRAVLGEALRSNSQLPEALEVLGEAARIEPDNGVVITNFGVALMEARRVDEAKPLLDRAWQLGPKTSALARTLASMAMAERDWERAIPYAEALALAEPASAEAHSMLTRACGAASQALPPERELEGAALMARAAHAAHRLVEIAPTAANLALLGGVLLDQNRAVEAGGFFERAVAAAPQDAEQHLHLGLARLAAARDEEAVAEFREAVRLRPGYARAYSNLTVALLRVNRVVESEQASQEAVRADPELAEAQLNRASVLVAARRPQEAIECLERALALKPTLAQAWAELGNAVGALGDPATGVAHYRRALELKPSMHEVASNLVFQQEWSALATPQAYLEDARKWEQCLRPPVSAASRARSDFRRPARQGRKLRVGYVSGDLRRHAVSKFIEPILQFHDHERFFVVAYTTISHEDEMTALLRPHFDQWTSLAGLRDEEAWRRVLDDEIDVLIDLSGHTRHNGLGVFARRGAPVQAHYIGYFASTGIAAMDYWIGDPVCVPPQFDAYFSETVWRLPRPWMCFRPERAVPEINWSPASDGSVVLGSFNNLTKLTPTSLDVWARILHEMPEARVMLKTGELDAPANRERVEREFAARGIDASRLLLMGKTADASQHHAMYDRLDIALDPIGAMGGVTTTCDALWMGVPVITRAGDRMSQRASASLLHGLGHPEWVAHSSGEYVEKVVSLARDLPLRTRLRAAQRAKMAASPLCDGPGAARALEDAYEKMFDAWSGSVA